VAHASRKWDRASRKWDRGDHLTTGSSTAHFARDLRVQHRPEGTSGAARRRARRCGDGLPGALGVGAANGGRGGDRDVYRVRRRRRVHDFRGAGELVCRESSGVQDEDLRGTQGRARALIAGAGADRGREGATSGWGACWPFDCASVLGGVEAKPASPGPLRGSLDTTCARSKHSSLSLSLREGSDDGFGDLQLL
jgi:hypothetical protein